MKINWFSPLSPAKTGIALCTEALVPALRERAELTLWTDQQVWDDRLDAVVSVRRFDPECPPCDDLNAADVNFYNIGNHRAFHEGIWQLSRQHAGVVILHDVCLQHFFADLYLNVRRDPDEYGRVMELYYGAEGRQAVYQFCTQTLSIEQLSASFPLTPLALENALCAVTHNRAGLQMPACGPSVPTVYLPLPYSSGTRSCMDCALKRNLGPPYRLITFGFIGPNRRLESFLEAWAGMPEKASFRLRICGQVWNSDHLSSRIRDLGLEDLAEVCGYLSERELNEELAQANLAINLRYPTMGEASLTQLLIWVHGLPALVTDIGWYATLPRDAVAFVRPDHEIEDIRLQLRAFLETPERFAEMGHRGQQTLAREHSPDSYAEALIELASLAREWSVRASRLKMAKRTGDEMRQWIAPGVRDMLIERTARAIWEIGGDAAAMKAGA